MRVRQIPGAPALLLAVGIARLGVPALSLAMLLAAREASGGYGMAGAVGAAYALAVAAFQLGWGRAADRRGATGIVRRTALAHGAALALFAALAQAGVTAALIPAAALAGACFPPVATVSRAAWREVEGEDERRALFALDGVTTEVTLIVGPLLATVLVAVAGAPTAVAVVAAMVAAAALSAAGSPLLPSGREDPPGVRPHASVEFHNRWLCKSTLARRKRSAEQRGELRSARWRGVPRVVGWRRRAGRRDGLRAAGGRDGLRGAGGRDELRGAGGRDALRGAGTRGALRGPDFPPALVTLLIATVAMAAAIGAATVASVVFAEDAALPSGLPLALMAVGGVVGALAWGARALPMSRRKQLVGGLGLYAAVMLATVIAPNQITLALLVAGGALMAPCDALQAQLCGELAPAERGAESFAWLNSANWVGYAAGTLLTGAVVDATTATGGFVACAAAAAAAILVLTTGPDAPTSPA